MVLLDLFVGFLIIGLFSFGGAYGAIPLIQEVVLSYGWIEKEKLAYMFAVSESTPGPIMVNMATYVGSQQAGIPGAIVATFAVVLPAFLFVILLTLLFKNLVHRTGFKAVLQSVTTCVIGIILATGVFLVFNKNFGEIREFAVNSQAIMLTGVLLTVYFISKRVFKKGLSPIMFILIAGGAGVLVFGL